MWGAGGDLEAAGSPESRSRPCFTTLTPFSDVPTWRGRWCRLARKWQEEEVGKMAEAQQLQMHGWRGCAGGSVRVGLQTSG